MEKLKSLSTQTKWHLSNQELNQDIDLFYDFVGSSEQPETSNRDLNLSIIEFRDLINTVELKEINKENNSHYYRKLFNNEFGISKNELSKYFKIQSDFKYNMNTDNLIQNSIGSCDFNSIYSDCGIFEKGNILIIIKPLDITIKNINDRINYIMRSYDGELKEGKQSAWEIYNLGGDDDVDYSGTYLDCLIDCLTSLKDAINHNTYNLGELDFNSSLTNKSLKENEFNIKFSIGLESVINIEQKENGVIINFIKK